MTERIEAYKNMGLDPEVIELGERVRKDIAERFAKSEGNVSVILNRLRKKLKAHLTERGYGI